MELYDSLNEAGLTRNESKVYLELVKRGELSANQIAKNLGIDRTLTYTILNHLIEKGQVNYVFKNKKKVLLKLGSRTPLECYSCKGRAYQEPNQ